MKLKIPNQIFGELETKIMRIIWELKQASVRQVFDKLFQNRSIAYTTVMTVMSRLYSKGILKRRSGEGGAYIYIPRQSQEEFSAAASKRMIRALINEFGEIAVAQFIDIVESSDRKNLSKWRRKLKNIK